MRLVIRSGVHPPSPDGWGLFHPFLEANTMSRIVRGALFQATWPGSKEKMIDKHVAAAEEAARQGAQIMCWQELFYGPYFCQVQDPKHYSWTEPMPNGPTTKLA